jgi:O-antigen/teichoic acid export membrane protein
MSFFGPTSPPLLNETTAPLLRRALHHARVVGSFAFAQAGVQLIGFLTGILLVRYLDPREYAYFTIANTMQGTINVLADVGISVGLISIGGKVWQDPHRFGQLIVTALHVRRRLGIIAAAAVTPLLLYMLLINGASVLYSLALAAVVLLGLAVQLTVGVHSVVPRLLSNITKIQRIDLTGAIARLAAILALLLVFMNAGIAVAIGSATLLLQYVMLRKYVATVVDLHAPQNADDRATMHSYIRKQAANAVFFCVQGQISIFLIGFFARDATAVAEVGALGRLAMIFAVMSNLLTNVFAPAFARCHEPRRLRWQYAGIISAVTAFSAVLIATAALFPQLFLLVLGPQYTHLERELVLMVAAACASALTGTFWALNSAKAWITGAWLYIPLTLAAWVVMIPFTDFASVRSVLIFGLVSAVPNLLLNIALSYRGFRTHPAANT